MQRRDVLTSGDASRRMQQARRRFEISKALTRFSNEIARSAVWSGGRSIQSLSSTLRGLAVQGTPSAQMLSAAVVPSCPLLFEPQQ